MPKEKYRQGLWARLQKLAQNDEAKDPSREPRSREDSQHADSEAESPPKKAVSEAELMATAFKALSTGEVHIDWESIETVSECAPQSASTDVPPEGPDSSHPPLHSANAKELSGPQVDFALVTNPENQPAQALDPSQWQGRHWREGDAWSLLGDPLGQGTDAQDPFDQADPNRLSSAQKELLQRFQRLSNQEITELYLRGLSRSHAQKRLAECITLMRRTHRRYLRVVTGKGIGSAGAPVLRRQIISWCILQAHQKRLQWSPEPDSNHEYGAIVVDLQQPTRSQ